MKNILVIDQATINTAYTVISIEDGIPKWKLCSLVKLHGSKEVRFRIHHLYNILTQVIKENNIDTLVIEEVIMTKSKNWSATSVLLELRGVMELMSVQYNLKLYVMNIVNWKHTAGIKTTTRDKQKAESIKLALKRFSVYKDIIVGSDDVSDALNMSYAFLKNEKII